MVKRFHGIDRHRRSVLADNGVVLPRLQKNHLLSVKRGEDVLEDLDISEASRISIAMNLEILWHILEKKEELVKEILRIGEPLKEEVELLISIRGITPLTAMAFLADVGDVRRFKTLRKMNAYLGLVPKMRESGGFIRSGHINRASKVVDSDYSHSVSDPDYRCFALFQRLLR